MRGVLFKGNREVEVTDFPDPTPGPGEVVIEIKASGMCGSDLNFYRAAPGEAQKRLGLPSDGEPFIGGHEPCGVVAARGPGVAERAAPIGQRVMDHHYAGCGVCNSCRQGWSQLCPDGFVVYGVTTHGAHAQYMVAAAQTLVPLDESLSFEAGAAIACGTGTAYGALRRMQVAGGGTLAVFGQGPVGLSANLLGEAMGLRVIAVELGAERLSLATDYGAADTVDAGNVDTVEALKALTKGRGVDYALDCTGSSHARIAAIRGTRTWGTVCFVGEGGDVTIDVSPDMLRKQLTVIGSWTFSSVGQAECAQFIVDNGLDVDSLFTHRYPLQQAAEAYQLFDTQTTGKGVFIL
jgi:threonine dehydrogenase-like Zn-dependent dehydrogenase